MRLVRAHGVDVEGKGASSADPDAWELTLKELPPRVVAMQIGTATKC